MPAWRERIIAQSAERILHELAGLLPGQPNEAEFRQVMDRLLGDFGRQLGICWLPDAEYTLATGRADAVFNRLVIQYKRPGTLWPRHPHQATAHAIVQVRDSLQTLAQQERQGLPRMAGVVFDGYHIVFVRYHTGQFQVEPPVPVSSASLQRFLDWMASTALGIALTAENLSRDFSFDQPRTQNILRALTHGLKNVLPGDSRVANLLAQWRIFFSQSVDSKEAFGGRNLQAFQKWLPKAGWTIRTSEEAEHFFFALHSYFALLVKLLGWLALSRHRDVKLGLPSPGELASADADKLRRHLQELESGGIFRTYGLTNLLEGDFFAWYLFAWDTLLEEALRELLRRLDQYEPATLAIHPEESRDLFKKLYHSLLPRQIRHPLGEYYTPDWLAQRLLAQVDKEFFTAELGNNEHRLRQKLFQTRWLDPACGSGTFLLLLIARMQELGQALMVDKRELLRAILNNVVGFDLNPLAVLTARINYLLAIADLLGYRKGEVSIPVYLADSVRTPATGEKLLLERAYEVPTAVGTFLVPAFLCSQERFDRFCHIVEESVRASVSPEAFVRRVEKALAPPEWQPTDADLIRQLYQQILAFRRQGRNGLGARLLRNTLAPLTVGQFDYIVGNPPWINWEHLPKGYRERIKPLWQQYGLFPHGGMDTILGKGKKDISMLMTFTVMDKLLKEGGKLGFVITQSLFKTSGAGQGFRRFQIPQRQGKPTPLRVVHVDDMVSLQPFQGAANRTAVMVLQKGKPTTYPVPYTVWRKKKGSRFTSHSTLQEVIHTTVRLHLQAEPVDPNDVASPWLTARPRALKAIRKLLGPSDYPAHEGANSGGANAVYWLQIVDRRPDGLLVVRNITEGAKVHVDEVLAPIEPALLYPLLRGRDVQRWQAQPSAWILMTQDPKTRRGYPEDWLQDNCPYTYGYLKRFEPILRRRAAFRRYFTRKEKNGKIVPTAPFYSMFNVGPSAFAPWKVVWTRLAKMEAAVVGFHMHRPIVPQETVALVECSLGKEAHYICALVNSLPFQVAAASYSQESGKSMGSMHILEHLRIPRFDPKNPVHCRLAELSAAAHEAAGSAHTHRLHRIEAEIDRQAARLWGLTQTELDELQQTLRELAK